MVTRPSFPFYGLVAFGFRPRLAGATARRFGVPTAESFTLSAPPVV